MEENYHLTEIQECSICYENVSVSNIVKINCNHEFCGFCVKKIINSDIKNCAFCRTKIECILVNNSEMEKKILDGII